MADRIAEIVVLAEDYRQGHFAAHYLKRDGHSYRNIRLNVSPSGQGSGAQYVLKHYADEVRLYRTNSSRRKSALIAQIDADTGTVAERVKEFENALRKAKGAKRKESDQIALLIPKRHIETWILCLTGEHVKETTRYDGRADLDERIRTASAKFYEWSRSGYSTPASCVPSLKLGLSEIRRID